MFYDICIFINKQVDIYSLAKLQLKTLLSRLEIVGAEKARI